METTNSPVTTAGSIVGTGESAADKARRQTNLRASCSTGKQLIGMSVISLADGEVQGQVHDVIYNPLQGRLIGFTVTRGGGFLSRGETFYLAADNLRAVGEDAITLESARALQSIEGDVSSAAEDAGQPVLGKRLMTEGGKFLGNIDDVLIDRASRRVVAYEVSGGLWHDMMKGQTDVPVEHITSIGHDVVIVPEFVEAQVEETTGGLAATAEAAKVKAAEIKDATAEKIEEARTSASIAIENKEADYARGKVVGRDVFLDDANTLILARNGEIVTDAHIAQATAAGKMHALAAAAGYAHASDIAHSAREKAGDLADAARAKAADLSETAKDKQGALLVGKTTAQAVVSDTGILIVPDNHVVTEADVFAARASGKLGNLSAAVGASYVEDARDRAAVAYDSAKERAGDAYDAARERAAVTTAAAPVTAGTPTIIIQNPEQVIVQSPDATVTTPATTATTTTGDTSVITPIPGSST